MMAAQKSHPRNRCHTPTRRCIVTGETRPKDQLLRFVADPEGQVVPDLAERLPGRGLWMMPRRDILRRACEKNLFAKAAKVSLKASPSLPEDLDRLLVNRCLNLLGLAKGAGLVSAGFEKAKAAVGAGKARLLVQAADGAEHGRGKLTALAGAGDKRTEVVEVFSAADIGRALGRGPTVHVAVANGGAAERFLREVDRLSVFRDGEDRVKEVTRAWNKVSA